VRTTGSDATADVIAGGTADSDGASNEQGAARRAEELERLPRGFVAVLGGPCGSNRESGNLQSKRIQLAAVLLLNIVFTSVLLFRYQVRCATLALCHDI
jgi:hypothetical protein